MVLAHISANQDAERCRSLISPLGLAIRTATLLHIHCLFVYRHSLIIIIIIYYYLDRVLLSSLGLS